MRLSPQLWYWGLYQISNFPKHVFNIFFSLLKTFCSFCFLFFLFLISRDHSPWLPRDRSSQHFGKVLLINPLSVSIIAFVSHMGSERGTGQMQLSPFSRWRRDFSHQAALALEKVPEWHTHFAFLIFMIGTTRCPPLQTKMSSFQGFPKAMKLITCSHPCSWYQN